MCSYQRVFPKMNEPQEKAMLLISCKHGLEERLVLLEKADGLLTEIWKALKMDLI